MTKIKVKVNGNPVEIELAPFTMGDMIDFESEISKILEPKDSGLDSHARLKLTAEIIGKVVQERHPELQWQGVQRALPYGKIAEIWIGMLSGKDDEKNGDDSKPVNPLTTGIGV